MIQKNQCFLAFIMFFGLGIQLGLVQAQTSSAPIIPTQITARPDPDNVGDFEYYYNEDGSLTGELSSDPLMTSIGWLTTPSPPRRDEYHNSRQTYGDEEDGDEDMIFDMDDI